MREKSKVTAEHRKFTHAAMPGTNCSCLVV